MPIKLFQDDPRWAKTVMWEGGTIEDEGCLLASLTMVLLLLDNQKNQYTTPDKLNDFAHDKEFYSIDGKSGVQLYADICLDASNGRVQLLAKEEYLSGEEGWIAHFASDSYLLKKYRVLPLEIRKNYAIMVKIGTHDDSFASHYFLVDPNEPGDVCDNDFKVFDPAQPYDSKATCWTLSSSYEQIRKDPDIATKLDECQIEELQISGVWLFGSSSNKIEGVKNSMLENFIQFE
jgi:hypothetical protein